MSGRVVDTLCWPLGPCGGLAVAERLAASARAEKAVRALLHWVSP